MIKFRQHFLQDLKQQQHREKKNNIYASQKIRFNLNRNVGKHAHTYTIFQYFRLDSNLKFDQTFNMKGGNKERRRKKKVVDFMLIKQFTG